MRVNATNSNIAKTDVSESQRTGKAGAIDTAKKKGGPAKPIPVGDPTAAKADISPRGREMAYAKEVAQAAPDVREEKIAELKRRIAAGQYNVDPDAVADRLVNEHIRTAGIG